MCVCASKSAGYQAAGKENRDDALIKYSTSWGFASFFSFYLTRCHSVKSVRKACPYKGLPLTLKYSFDVAIPGE